ncbi:hypothetical protein HanRHA438_Chr10g0473401 [Helianthus annuus]|nr:hypothetical protein HanRHA438_Chr10g0473401 [Helianthus annuus]
MCVCRCVLGIHKVTYECMHVCRDIGRYVCRCVRMYICMKECMSNTILIVCFENEKWCRYITGASPGYGYADEMLKDYER